MTEIASTTLNHLKNLVQNYCGQNNIPNEIIYQDDTTYAIDITVTESEEFHYFIQLEYDQDDAKFKMKLYDCTYTYEFNDTSLQLADITDTQVDFILDSWIDMIQETF